jgi:hypothetical protein
VGEIPAHAHTLNMTLEGGTVAARVLISERDVVMHVIADRLHALPAADDAAKLRPRQAEKFFRVAVAAHQKINYCVIWQTINFSLLGVGRQFIGQATILNDEVVANFKRARRGNKPRADIAEGVNVIARG